MQTLKLVQQDDGKFILESDVPVLPVEVCNRIINEAITQCEKQWLAQTVKDLPNDVTSYLDMMNKKVARQRRFTIFWYAVALILGAILIASRWL